MRARRIRHWSGREPGNARDRLSGDIRLRAQRETAEGHDTHQSLISIEHLANVPFEHETAEHVAKNMGDQRVVERIAPLLAGQEPDVWGAVLVDLTVTWISGYYPAALRGEILEAHITALRTLAAALAGR